MKRDYAGLRLPDDFTITVCAECKRACCWQGEFMCDDARYADIAELTVAELKTVDAGEHWEWWEKDVGAQEWLEAKEAEKTRAKP